MITIKRIIDTGRATLGAFFIDDKPICFTLEDTQTYRDEHVFCIPPGAYKLARVRSIKFGECFTVLSVPGHDLLRVHWGNGPDDTEGCILVGLQLDATDGGHIWASKAAFKIVMEALKDVEECDISFINCY